VVLVPVLRSTGSTTSCTCTVRNSTSTSCTSSTGTSATLAVLVLVPVLVLLGTSTALNRCVCYRLLACTSTTPRAIEFIFPDTANRY
jgi:hypothetical protein